MARRKPIRKPSPSKRRKTKPRKPSPSKRRKTKPRKPRDLDTALFKVITARDKFLEQQRREAKRRAAKYGKPGQRIKKKDIPKEPVISRADAAKKRTYFTRVSLLIHAVLTYGANKGRTVWITRIFDIGRKTRERAFELGHAIAARMSDANLSFLSIDVSLLP